jgi:uncharacterized alkaline shock family protein YloU
MKIQTSPAGTWGASGMDGDRARPVARQGKIEVSAQAIATIAGRAVTECYGVVGIAAKHPRFGRVEMLAPQHYGRGVEVRFVSDHVAIELYVVLEYGLRISEIARNLIKDVKYAVEQSLGLPVVEVGVNVQGLRVGGRVE